jgi:hypothetical protein
MNRRGICDHAKLTESGTYYCDTYHPDHCPYPAIFCRVKDRRDEAAAYGKPKDTLWEKLVEGV